MVLLRVNSANSKFISLRLFRVEKNEKMSETTQDHDERYHISEMFDYFRPICVKLTRERTVLNLKELQKALRKYENKRFREIGEYLLFPLRLILRQEIKSESLVLHTLDCMTLIFSNTVELSWNLFSDVFVQLFMLTSSPKEESKVSQTSEELKTAVIRCVKALLPNITESGLQQMYQIYFCPSLGHAVYYLLFMAENEKSRALKVEAVDVIGQFIMLSQKGDSQLKKLAGDRFAAFLPGISLALGRIINDNPSQVVIVSALQTWSHVISAVMSDQQLSDISEENCEVTPPGKDSKLPCLPEVTRNKAWVSDTSTKMEVLVRRTVTLVTHSHWKVRLALVQWAEILLFECPVSLEVCISPLLEVVITLSVDSYTEVAKRSVEVLKRFSEHYIKEDAHSLLDIVEEDLHILATRLPRIMKSGDDSHRLVVLHLLSGYLHLLGPSMNNLLYSLPHQSRLISALLQLSELDITDVHLLEEGWPVQNSESNFFSKPQWPKKSFKHFRNEKICKSLIHVCHLLGYYGDLSLLVDCLLEKIQESTVYRKQALFVLNEIVLGVKHDIFENDERCLVRTQGSYKRETSLEDLTELIRNLLEEYLSSEYWDVVISNVGETSISSDPSSTSSHHSSLSFEKLNSNILQSCLLLEGVAKFAEVLGPGFHNLLMNTLCPILEKAGSQCSLVAHTANIALYVIAISCGYSSLTALITQNADYLVNSLTPKLLQYTHNHEASIVLKVVLQQCDIGILGLIQDPVMKIISLVDQYHTKKPLPLLNVLHSVVSAVQKGYSTCATFQEEVSETRTESRKESENVQKKLAPEGIRDFFLEYHNLKLAADLNREDDETVDFDKGNNNEDLPECPPVNEDNEVVEDKELPLHVKIVLEILQRCIHLQSHQDHWVRLCILNIIAAGVTALKDHQDTLLPVVHQLWSPFLRRFSDDQIVTMKAFETLLAMAEACGNFLRRRTLKDVWPQLVDLLRKQSKVSFGKDSASSYRFTINYKHQLTLLTGLGPLAVKLDIQDKEVELLAAACHPYLNCKQPLPLQQMAMKTFEHLMSIDSCVIWLYLNTIYSPVKELHHSHPDFLGVKFGSFLGLEYEKNVEELLKILTANFS